MTDKQRSAVETAAQAVLDARAQFLAPVGQTSGLPVGGASGSQSKNARAGAATPPEEALTGRPEVCPTRTATLADLYDPRTMPAPLLKAHQELDRAVDRCYRAEPFPSDRHRVEYLFALCEKLTAPLMAPAKPARKGRKMSPQSPGARGRDDSTLAGLGCPPAAHPG